ncbi:MAG: hypothetical protein L3J51_00575 [Cocleimonas sp.]|nr:hypothetical protein [Cocleimonas sp.]
MKKIIISTVLLVSSISTHANNFNMPWGNNNGYNNGSNWNMPNMNWGNNGNNANTGYNNGSNWNMPTMNWGNNSNGYNNGSNMNMPTMPWGNNNGSNWNMPTMNWGNNGNSGYNGNNGFNNGTNWNMPNMNWGNGNNQPWNFGNSVGNTGIAMPNVQYRAPAMPVAPQFIPRLNAQNKVPAPAHQKPITKKEIKAVAPAAVKVAPPSVQTQAKIPMPSEVKGTILAPENKVESVEIKK